MGRQKADKADLEQLRSSMVRIQIGGRVYPAVRSPRCKICTHPARVEIEERLLLNDQYPRIVEFVSGRVYQDVTGEKIEWPPITAQQLSNHFNNGHCPVDTELVKQFTTERERELGVDYSQMTGRVVDHVIATKLVLSRGQERLLKGDVEPTVKETLEAAKLLALLGGESDNDQADQLTAWSEAMEIFFTTARRIMSPDQFQQLGAELYSNPILRELTAKLQAQPSRNELTESEMERI